MTIHSPEEVARHVRVYVTVFGALLALTTITVAASYLNVSMGVAILIALLIASVKGSLVACYFMHLLSERKLILAVLLLTVTFFVILMSLPVLDVANNAGAV